MMVETKPTVRLSWPCRLILVALAACILPISLMAQSEETPDEVGDRPASVAEVSDAENDADTAATQSPPVYFDVATGTVVYANDPELRRAGGIDVLAQSKTDSNDATAEPADD